MHHLEHLTRVRDCIRHTARNMERLARKAETFAAWTTQVRQAGLSIRDFEVGEVSDTGASGTYRDEDTSVTITTWYEDLTDRYVCKWELSSPVLVTSGESIKDLAALLGVEVQNA